METLYCDWNILIHDQNDSASPKSFDFYSPHTTLVLVTVNMCSADAQVAQLSEQTVDVKDLSYVLWSAFLAKVYKPACRDGWKSYAFLYI
jgi:hypothetical protein